jgi:hypothetical protein
MGRLFGFVLTTFWDECDVKRSDGKNISQCTWIDAVLLSPQLRADMRKRKVTGRHKRV